MLRTIANRLTKFPLTRVQPISLAAPFNAAVLVILGGPVNDPQVTLTQRALHLNSHAGEVAFPGGMWDPVDRNLLDTAMREAREEVGLAAHSVRPVATLPVASPRRREISVTPFVAIADEDLELTADAGEIAAIFNVPLKAFLDHKQYQYFDINMDDEKGARVIRFPFLTYNNYQIWGFTLKVITDLLNSTYDAGLQLDYPVHEEPDETD